MYNDFKGENDKLKLDLIRNMLVLDPKKRITVERALHHVEERGGCDD